MIARKALAYLKDMVTEATYCDDEAFEAIAVLEACVNACEIVAQNGQYNQYSLSQLKVIALAAYYGDTEKGDQNENALSKLWGKI